MVTLENLEVADNSRGQQLAVLIPPLLNSDPVNQDAVQQIIGTLRSDDGECLRRRS